MGLFGPSKEEKMTKEILLENYKEIYDSMHMASEPFKALLKFFNATSKIQDDIEVIVAVLEKNIPKKDQEGQNALNAFKELIRKGGRSPYGINRSQKGHTVSAGDIFLGNVHGLNTKDMNFWMNTSDKHALKIVSEQAGNFVSSYKEMPTIIKKLLTYLKVNI